MSLFLSSVALKLGRVLPVLLVVPVRQNSSRSGAAAHRRPLWTPPPRSTPGKSFSSSKSFLRLGGVSPRTLVAGVVVDDVVFVVAVVAPAGNRSALLAFWASSFSSSFSAARLGDSSGGELVRLESLQLGLGVAALGFILGDDLRDDATVVVAVGGGLGGGDVRPPAPGHGRPDGELSTRMVSLRGGTVAGGHGAATGLGGRGRRGSRQRALSSRSPRVPASRARPGRRPSASPARPNRCRPVDSSRAASVSRPTARRRGAGGFDVRSSGVFERACFRTSRLIRRVVWGMGGGRSGGDGERSIYPIQLGTLFGRSGC